MLGKIVVGAVGLGVVAGAVASSKFTKTKNDVVNKIRPRKNKVAVIEVEMDDGVDPSELRFVVINPVKTRKSVHRLSSEVENEEEQQDYGILDDNF